MSDPRSSGWSPTSPGKSNQEQQPAAPVGPPPTPPAQGPIRDSAPDSDWGTGWVDQPAAVQRPVATPDPTTEPAWSEGYYESLDRHKGPKVSRGPRFSGVSLLGGLGLLGLLVTIAILGVMAVRILSDANDLTAVPDKPSESRSGAEVDPARQQMCAVNLRTLQTAVQADRAATGRLPADQDQLVADGILDAPIPTHTFSLVDGQPVFEGLGECA